jgi:hypothetical protein
MNSQWYYAQNGQQLGPVSGEQLRAMVASGAVRSTDLVWSDSLPAWTAAGQVPALLPAPAPPPAAVYTPPPAPVYVAPPAPAPRPVPAPAPVPVQTWNPPHQAAPVSAQGGGDVSQEVVEILAKTKPWVRLIAVLGFIAMGLALLGAGIAVVVGASSGMGAGPMLLQAGVMILQFLILFPALLFLNRYASRIGSLVSNGQPQDLEEALSAQKSYWKYVGILVLVLIILAIIGVIAAVVLGAALFRL